MAVRPYREATSLFSVAAATKSTGIYVGSFPLSSPRATPVLVVPFAANFAGVREAECPARAPVVAVIPVLLEEGLEAPAKLANTPAGATTRVSEAAVERLAPRRRSSTGCCPGFDAEGPNFRK